MYVHLPDPHPGRCLNVRTDPGDPYRVKTLRCLGAEGHEGRCRFPAPSWSYGSTSENAYTPRNPEPWVVPVEFSADG